MEAHILFSVIIPGYNREMVLDHCLMSLEKQIFKNFEILVCDNGLKDNTKEIITKYEKILNLKYIYTSN